MNTIETIEQMVEALQVEPTEVEMFRLVPKPHITKAIQAGRALLDQLDKQGQDVPEVGFGNIKHGQGELVLFNPYTGQPRDVRDVQSDPQGVLIVPLGKVEMQTSAPRPSKK